jgi:sugar/nucleoside kinase (ribokinase family)
MHDVILLGEYFFDQIFSGMPQMPELGREIYCDELVTAGGAMFITATTLTRLGARVGWPAHFGNDYYSKSVLDLALHERINLSLINLLPHSYQRMTVALPLHGERAFVTHIDPEVDHTKHWMQILEQESYRHVHIGGIMPVEKLQPIIDTARGKGATISLDCQDSPMLSQPCSCRDVLPLVDIFMPNAREALIVAEEHDVAAALSRLMQDTQMVIIKDGDRGAWIGYDGHTELIPGIQAGSVVDTTGAGDCFNGGFLYGYIVAEVSPEESMRYGNICGGLSVTAVGGATASPTRAELERWL